MSTKKSTPSSTADLDGGYLGADQNDVRGLKGVDDDLEDSMKVQATELTGKDGPKGPAHKIAGNADKTKNVMCHAVAMYAFKATDPGRELNFEAGDIIHVTDIDCKDGWWHGWLNEKWGAFPLSYVHCVLKFRGHDYLVLPAGWMVHKSDGDKGQVGTYDTEKKTLTQPDGKVVDWSNGYLIGSPETTTQRTLWAVTRMMRGLAGVDDTVEDALKTKATELAGRKRPAGPFRPLQTTRTRTEEYAATQCCVDFEGSDPSRDLSLKAGNVINVTEMDNSDGWWHEYRRQVGGLSIQLRALRPQVWWRRLCPHAV